MEIISTHTLPSVGKIFMNGRSQAIRLPKQYRFDCSQVFIEKHGDKLVISAHRPSWDEFFDAESAFDASFMSDREDSLPQERVFD